MDAHEAKDANAISEVTRSLYGDSIGAADGVLHVVAVVQQGEQLRVIRVGPHAPRSDVDLFALSLARARVDAIVVSGAVLRAEPTLRYDLGGPGESGRGLAAWRREVAGKTEPPWLLVLTESGDLPVDHPVWESWARPIVYTTRETAASLVLPHRVEIVGRDMPTPRDAIRHLQADRDCRGVSIEAGPRVAAPLYDPPMAIDELMLTVFAGVVDERAAGPPFLRRDQLEARLRRTAPATVVKEPSGTWTFSRWLSPSRRGTAAGSR